MATGKINLSPKQSAILSVSSYTEQVNYRSRRVTKYGSNTIHITLIADFSINIPVNTNIARIPEEYRPSNNIYVPAILATDAGKIIIGDALLNKNGEISQGLTGYMRDIFIDTFYDQ